MYCPNCGTPNNLNAESCLNCKQILPRPNPVPPVPVSSPGEQKHGGNEAEKSPAHPLYYPGLPGSQYSYTPTPNIGPVAYGSPYPTYTPFVSGLAQNKAGFWVRFGAGLLDSIIVGLVALIIIGASQLVYWSSFATRYGDELGRACAETVANTSGQDLEADKVCENTATSIFIERNELGAVTAISLSFSLLAGLLGLIYYVGLTAQGATLGKRVFGLKVVQEDGSPPGFGRALLRQTVGYWISSAVFYLGFLWIAFDDQKQGWHDKISQTYVVRA